MPTGAAWNIDEEAPAVPKPWANFDTNATLDIPFDWATWLADKGTTYASHVILTDANLECTQSSHLAGVITARIRKATSGTLTIGSKYTVTCRITTANGQIEDQTLYLKAANK